MHQSLKFLRYFAFLVVEPSWSFRSLFRTVALLVAFSVLAEAGHAASGGYCYVGVQLSPIHLPSGWSWELYHMGPIDSRYWFEASGSVTAQHTAYNASWGNLNVDWLLRIKKGEYVYKEFEKSCGPGDKNLTFNVVLSPDSPVTFASKNLTDRIRLTWTSTNLATSYSIWRALSSDLGTQAVIASGLTAKTYDDQDVLNDTSYDYWVVGVDGDRSSAAETFSKGPTKGLVA